LRILHGPGASAGQPFALAKAQRDLGLDSIDLLVRESKFQYKSSWKKSIKDAKAFLKFSEEELSKFDVVHFHGFSPWHFFGPAGFEAVSGLKESGTKIIHHFRGSEARVPSIFFLRNGEPWSSDFLLPAWKEERVVSTIRAWETLADQTLFVDPEIRGYLSKGTSLNRLSDDYLRFRQVSAPKKPFRVLHAPSRRAMKGTEFLLDAKDDLEANGIELILAENLDHASLVQLMGSVDLVVDQLRLGWYGVMSVEAFSMGIPVYVYIRPDLQCALPHELRPMVASKGGRLSELLALIEAIRETPERFSEVTRNHWETQHSPIAVARRSLELYEEVLDDGISSSKSPRHQDHPYRLAATGLASGKKEVIPVIGDFAAQDLARQRLLGGLLEEAGFVPRYLPLGVEPERGLRRVITRLATIAFLVSAAKTVVSRFRIHVKRLARSLKLRLVVGSILGALFYSWNGTKYFGIALWLLSIALFIAAPLWGRVRAAKQRITAVRPGDFFDFRRLPGSPPFLIVQGPKSVAFEAVRAHRVTGCRVIWDTTEHSLNSLTDSELQVVRDHMIMVTYPGPRLDVAEWSVDTVLQLDNSPQTERFNYDGRIHHLANWSREQKVLALIAPQSEDEFYFVERIVSSLDDSWSVMLIGYAGHNYNNTFARILVGLSGGRILQILYLPPGDEAEWLAGVSAVVFTHHSFSLRKRSLPVLRLLRVARENRIACLVSRSDNAAEVNLQDPGILCFDSSPNSSVAIASFLNLGRFSGLGRGGEFSDSHFRAAGEEDFINRVKSI